MSIVAIDQGTTSTRALCVLDNGQSTLVYAEKHKQIYPRTGWVEHDPVELLDNIYAAIAAAIKYSARFGEKLQSIGMDNQGESCVAWNADTGIPVSPIIVWQDTRTQSEIDTLRQNSCGATVRSLSGLPLDPYFSASKLAWILTSNDEAKQLRKVGKLRLGTTDAFFIDRMTGRYVTDITTASRTSLMNIATGEWDSTLCEIFGVPEDVLPEIVSTVGCFGSVSVCGNTVPVTVSVVDQQASLYGHGCRAPGDSKFTFGTGAFALTLTGESPVVENDFGLLPTVAWQAADGKVMYALDGAVYSACSALNWAKSIGLFHKFSEINQFDNASAIERGLAFVPALSGLACPHWDRTATGLWIGLGLDTNALDMVQAIIEGVAFRACEVINAMNTQISGSADGSTYLSIDGGLSRNPYFCQFLANISGRSVKLSESTEITATGTAMMVLNNEQRIDGNTSSMVTGTADNSDWMERFSDAISRSKGWHTEG